MAGAQVLFPQQYFPFFPSLGLRQMWTSEAKGKTYAVGKEPGLAQVKEFYFLLAILYEELPRPAGNEFLLVPALRQVFSL